ncbi:MAG: hypothetical protein MJZ69_06115 [Bacteroidaceae bacterium]|nr:hypothetical protein [Bacteroidaceae bacterium]
MNWIIIDTAFLEALTTDFIANFGRMLNRPLGPADLCRWLDCLLLDAGVEEGEHANFVALIHPKTSKTLKTYVPSNFQEELNDKAFKDRLGEFSLSSYPVEDLTNTSDFITESLRAALEDTKTTRILLIADMAAYGDTLVKVMDKEVPGKSVYFFTMQPLPPGPYHQPVLGYSVMNALGIRGDEL